MYGTPGNGFIVRVVSPNSGTDAAVHVFSRADLERISGSLLTLTAAASTTSVACTTLGSTNQYVGRTIEFTAGTAGNIGQRRVITAENMSTQVLTLASALPASPAIGDTFKILSPIPKPCAKIGLSAVSAMNPTVTANIGWAYSVTQQSGKVWKGTKSATTTVTHHDYQSFGFPIDFGLGPDETVTISVTNGTWAQNIEFYFHFYAA